MGDIEVRMSRTVLQLFFPNRSGFAVRTAIHLPNRLTVKCTRDDEGSLAWASLHVCRRSSRTTCTALGEQPVVPMAEVMSGA